MKGMLMSHVETICVAVSGEVPSVSSAEYLA